MAYNRLKLFWGAVDITHTDEAPYSAAQTKPMGETAQPPGIGVRRCQVVYTRSPSGSVEDVATTSHDFLNITSGNPDDTWVDADFVTVESLLDTFFTSLKPILHSSTKVTSYRWYRIGPGVPPPNPAVRITTKSIQGTGADAQVAQVACSVTEKTAIRREWGRFYLPGLAWSLTDPTTGRFHAANLGTVNNAAGVLYAGASSAEFPAVVYSKTRGKAYTVESTQVDDVPDVIRSRRFDRPLLRLVKP